MSASVTFTQAAAFQDYIRQFHPQLLSKLFYGFSTGNLITTHEGVKGHKVLTELILGTMVRRWKKTFDPQDNTIDYKPSTLYVYPAKVDVQIYPQEYEDTYLGMSRKPGFSVNDWPFQAYVMDKIMAKILQEMEIAIWQGQITGSSTADPLNSLLNGFLKQIADAVTATTLTEVSTGALEEAEIIGQVEAVHAALSPAMRFSTTYGFVSLNTYNMYLSAYRDQISKYSKVEQVNGTEMVRLDFAPAYLVPTVGLQDSDKIIFTGDWNLHRGHDSSSDQMFRVQEIHRSLDFMMDFKFGATVGILHNDVIRVNDGA